MNSPLTFNSTRRDLNNVFPVLETNVLYSDPESHSIKTYPEKKILINANSNEVLSVVRNNFSPINHEEAYLLGVSIFKNVFGVTPEVHRENTNRKKTDYFVDLVSERCKIIIDAQGYRYTNGEDNNIIQPESNVNNVLESRERERTFDPNFQDVYHPFVRVSNFLKDGSSFYIELGYYRYRCSNGLMLGRRTKMTFKHSYSNTSFTELAIAAHIHFHGQKSRFMNAAEKIWILLNIYVSKDAIRSISFDIFEKTLLGKSQEERKKLRDQLYALTDFYISEIGFNLNAALNVATDFSKLLCSNSEGSSLSILQNYATSWMNRVSSKRFNLSKYLNEIKGKEEYILNAKDKKSDDDELVESEMPY